MFPAIGVIVVLVMVFGGFLITGGDLGAVMHALPHEMLLIGGAATGAIIAGNSMKELKQLGRGLAKILKGTRTNKPAFLVTTSLAYKLIKSTRPDGPLANAPHTTDPQTNTPF